MNPNENTSEPQQAPNTQPATTPPEPAAVQASTMPVPETPVPNSIPDPVTPATTDTTQNIPMPAPNETTVTPPPLPEQTATPVAATPQLPPAQVGQQQPQTNQPATDQTTASQTMLQQPASQEPATVVAANPSKKNVKKIIAIVAIVFASILVLLVVIGVAIRILGGGVPKYSETKEITFKGPSSTQKAGLAMQIPTEMEQYSKSDSRGVYQHQVKKDDTAKGTYGAIAADIQTVSFLSDLTQEQIDSIKSTFQGSEFDKEIIKDSSLYKNVKLSNKTVTDNGRKFRADVSLEIQSTDKDKSFKPGQGALVVYIDNRHVYTVYYLFIDEVYNANKAYWPKLEDSIKISQ